MGNGNSKCNDVYENSRNISENISDLNKMFELIFLLKKLIFISIGLVCFNEQNQTFFFKKEDSSSFIKVFKVFCRNLNFLLTFLVFLEKKRPGNFARFNPNYQH